MRGSGRPMTMVRSGFGLALLAGALSACAGGSSGASCIAVVEMDDQPYYQRSWFEGEIPTTGEMVDAVIPGCNDTGQDEPDDQIRVELIRDVPASTAVVFHDELYVRGGVQLPAGAGDWYPSVSCRESGALTLLGRFGGVSEPYQPYVERELTAPYEVDLLVGDGPYSELWLEVQVTTETESELTAADRDRKRVVLRATVDCDDGEFVAQSLQVR